MEVVLLEESEQPVMNDASPHILDQEWLRSAARNPAFEFLLDADEDVYSLADGKAMK